MSDQHQDLNLPAQIAEAVSGVPKALIPSSIKAIDRLVGALVDLPVAWLNQKRAKIDAQTQAYTLVEASIAKMASLEAGADKDVVQRALDVLVRKEYRRQNNREAIAVAMVEDLRLQQSKGDEIESSPAELDDDWLNVFERHAEDASTERMQKLWGRVLAGEIRKPGRYSMRTLRFLSEFSQVDALNFADFCNSAFGDLAPKALVQPNDIKDIRNLIFLESVGLLQGASGYGLKHKITFNEKGNGFLREGNLVVVFTGKPGELVETTSLVLSPLGQELITLLPERDIRQVARKVAIAMRTPVMESAYLATVIGANGNILPMEVLWQKEEETVASK